MLETLLGSTSCEQVLLFILASEDGYAREIARFYGVDYRPIRNQLDKLEAGGILCSRSAGRTRLYSFEPRCPYQFPEFSNFSGNDSRSASIFQGIEYWICRIGSVFDPRELNSLSPNAEETSESGKIDMKADDKLSEESPARSGLPFFELNPPCSL